MLSLQASLWSVSVQVLFMVKATTSLSRCANASFCVYCKQTKWCPQSLLVCFSIQRNKQNLC